MPIDNQPEELTAPAGEPEPALESADHPVQAAELQQKTIPDALRAAPPETEAGTPTVEKFARPGTPRSSLRAAISSNRQARNSGVSGQTEVISRDPPELERAAEVQNLIAKGQLLARQRQFEAARSLLSRALQLEPSNAEAWTWLGGLMIDLNLDRARLCLKRGLDLDPSSERARRGLIYVEEKLKDHSGQVHPERQLVLAQGGQTSRPDIKIGLEEIVEQLRQSGVEPEPINIPLGGARYRPAVEKGELVMPRVRRRRRLRFQVDWLAGSKSLKSRPFLFLTYALVAVAVGASLIFMFNFVTTARPVTAPLEAAAAVTPTPVLSPDESFSVRLRFVIGNYNRYYATARNLRQQVQHGRISWQEYQRNVKNLQNEIKNQKREVDGLAQAATPRLVNLYRELQNIAGLSNQAADNTAGGIENTNPEDLEESNRQFQEATRRLADLSRNLNVLAPLPLTGTAPLPPTAEIVLTFTPTLSASLSPAVSVPTNSQTPSPTTAPAVQTTIAADTTTPAQFTPTLPVTPATFTPAPTT